MFQLLLFDICLSCQEMAFQIVKMWGNYDGNAGGGFIQSQNDSSNNQSGATKKGSSTSLIPCAISQVLMAAPGASDSAQAGGLVVNDVELHTVCVCGIVRKIEVNFLF